MLNKKSLRPLIFLLIAGFVFVGCTTATEETDNTSSSSASSSTVSNDGVVTDNTETFTEAEVAAHSSSSDCWSIINGAVFDLTSYINAHPGGAANISSICGVDGTAAFEGNPTHDESAESQLDDLYIGDLAN